MHPGEVPGPGTPGVHCPTLYYQGTPSSCSWTTVTLLLDHRHLHLDHLLPSLDHLLPSLDQASSCYWTRLPPATGPGFSSCYWTRLPVTGPGFPSLDQASLTCQKEDSWLFLTCQKEDSWLFLTFLL